MYWREKGPVRWKRGITVGPYGVESIHVGNNTVDCLRRHAFDCLTVVFVLKRRVSIALITAYFPSMLIVLISFLSFWVDNQSVPGRVSLVITSLLALMTQLLSIRNRIPAVSYLTALDVWFFICVSYVACALFEFAIAHNLSKTQNEEGSKLRLPLTISRGLSIEKRQRIKSNWMLKLLFGSKLGKWLHYHLDQACRFLFPFSFIIVSIIYWTIYS